MRRNALTLLLALLAPLPAWAEPGTKGEQGIVSRDTYLRVDASVRSSAMAALRSGTEVLALETRGRWSRVSAGGTVGWVKEGTISWLGNPAASVPRAGRTQPEPAPPDPHPGDVSTWPDEMLDPPGRDVAEAMGAAPVDAAPAPQPGPVPLGVPAADAPVPLARLDAALPPPAEPAMRLVHDDLLVEAGAEHVDEAGGLVLTAPRNLHLRDEPTFNARLVGRVGLGSSVHVLERDGEWTRVASLDGAAGGWVVSAALATPPTAVRVASW